jgi:hypothetical protein
MKTIYKFPLAIESTQHLSLPAEFKVALVGLDPQEQPCLWLILDSTHLTYLTKIFIVGTGQPIPPQAKEHLGSFVQTEYVWHVFLA